MNANSLTANNDWLQAATARLSRAGVSTGRLDALVLLEDVTNKNRTHLLAHPELELTIEQLETLNSLIERRAKHIPLAYLRGKTEFYGREFIISEAVLEPRPESETMIELLKSLSLPTPLHLVDIGSGSGALGITAALELPQSHVNLLEFDKAALKISKLNTQNMAPGVQCAQSDLLKNSGPYLYDAVLANLPYVPESHQINEAAMNEPRIAIFGGVDGLDLYRRLFEQLPDHTNDHAYVLTEALPFQHHALAGIARTHDFNLIQVEDFIQLFQKN